VGAPQGCWWINSAGARIVPILVHKIDRNSIVFIDKSVLRQFLQVHFDAITDNFGFSSLEWRSESAALDKGVSLKWIREKHDISACLAPGHLCHRGLKRGYSAMIPDQRSIREIGTEHSCKALSTLSQEVPNGL
jgi:hypothetical protein